jgi:hypothetical protein
MLISIAKTPRNRQSGYSLLMVVFMVATILIFTAAITPSILIQGRREREAETIWRGEQYARAIGLYFRKFGRYPVKIDDLTAQTNGVRFLRQAYKEPMNKEDGSWRFIYVGANGQLIGSLTRTSLQQFGPTPPPPSGTATAANSQESQPQPLEGAVIGGNIVGVASKIKQSSLRVYKKYDTYEKWEFISNAQNGQLFQPPTPVQATPGTTPPPATAPPTNP